MKRRDPNWRWLRALGSPNEFLIKRSTAEKGSTDMREIDQEKVFHAFLKGVAVGLFAAYLFFLILGV